MSFCIYFNINSVSFFTCIFWMIITYTWKGNRNKKNKTHIHVAYKILTSDLKTHTESEVMEKTYFMQMEVKES